VSGVWFRTLATVAHKDNASVWDRLSHLSIFYIRVEPRARDHDKNFSTGIVDSPADTPI
jgi:hypothetical protein